jgi:hypothetical protein
MTPLSLQQKRRLLRKLDYRLITHYQIQRRIRKPHREAWTTARRLAKLKPIPAGR